MILSDIHANVTALNAVLGFINEEYSNTFFKIIVLGDYINYGPRPNETIEILKSLNLDLCINGNHENSYLNDDFSRFSSKRGSDSMKYTSSIISAASKEFIENNKNGFLRFEFDNKKILMVHGDLTDIYWGGMGREEMQKDIYSSFDYVFSGHTHIPHFVEVFFKTDRPEFRNRKKTIFINPGSVGQPRNQNNMAQFCVVDLFTESVSFKKISYNIELESSFFDSRIDLFYKERLNKGI